jgi:site-specific recombinase XerD
MNGKKRDSNDTPSGDGDILQAHIGPFMAELRAAGYAAKTLCTKRVSIEQFLRWRHRQNSRSRDVTEHQIRQFLANALEGDKSRCSVASRALFGFLNHLRRCDVVATAAPKHPEFGTPLEERYADFLRNEKGLAELSLKVYLPVAKDLLSYLEAEHRIRAVRRLNASLLRAYLLERARDRSSEWVRLLATSLRSFLRFLHAQGEVPNDLTAAIPTVRRWTQPCIPRTLTSAEVDLVLDAPNLATATGRRDHAILLLLARLGLRSSEVLSLELEDLRWRAGEILIRGKGNRQDLLPLPRDVGAAIARYLRLDRGVWVPRRVFLRTNAPRVPLTGPASIGHIVRHAMGKAGVQRPRQIAAHLFRHTLASRMLHRGAHLQEISQVLRHRALTSTEIYAKVDMGMLQEVVRPWPKNGGAQ